MKAATTSFAKFISDGGTNLSNFLSNFYSLKKFTRTIFLDRHLQVSKKISIYEVKKSTKLFENIVKKQKAWAVPYIEIWPLGESNCWEMVTFCLGSGLLDLQVKFDVLPNLNRNWKHWENLSLCLADFSWLHSRTKINDMVYSNCWWLQKNVDRTRGFYYTRKSKETILTST